MVSTKLLLIGAVLKTQAKDGMNVLSGLVIPLLELETLQGLDVFSPQNTSENKVFAVPVFLVGKLVRIAKAEFRFGYLYLLIVFSDC